MVDPQILRVRRGRSPNCSATGSVVGLAIGGALAAAVVLNAFADRFTRWVRPSPDDGEPGPGGHDPDTPTADDSPPDPAPSTPRLRSESFGGILAWANPPALLYVDHATAQQARDTGATPIGTGEAPEGALSAPTEVHLALTDRCPVACDDCYLGAGPDAGPDPDAASLRADLDALAEMGVFEVALGGGEVGMRSDLVALCDEVRARGMVPNLTTSGFGVTPRLAHELASRVGQVNVSLDGLDDSYAAVRGWDGRKVGLRALAALQEAGVRVGVNTVLTRENLPHLEAMGQALARLGVREWQWVRFKPAGRGRDTWDRLAPTADELASLWPRLLDIEATTGLTMRVDCALVPFVAWHAPSPELARRLGLTGCNGGESLWTRTADGRYAPCSFAHELVDDTATGDPRRLWQEEPTLQSWRQRAAAPPEPCASCTWREVCRGGCRVVAHHVTGDPLAPDPQCPQVLAWQARTSEVAP